MTALHEIEFGLQIVYCGGQVILSARGEVDLLTAPALDAVLSALVDQGYPDVVLDFAAIAFMDAAGLAVVARTSARLSTSGRELTIRSAPAMTRRLLDVTGVRELVRMDASDPDVTALGGEQQSGDHTRSVESGSVDRSSDLARVGSIPANNHVIDAALRLVTALADATVEGADGVSVTLERDGRMATVASSNDTIRRMDHHQYQTGEGPCLAAAAEGHWFHIESLAEEIRWPAFVPRAMEEGIASILSTPLMAADRPLGALNIYSNTERAFGLEQQELAALFATQASGILADADAGADVTDEQMSERIGDALLAVALNEHIAELGGDHPIAHFEMTRHNDGPAPR